MSEAREELPPLAPEPPPPGVVRATILGAGEVWGYSFRVEQTEFAKFDAARPLGRCVRARAPTGRLRHAHGYVWALARDVHEIGVVADREDPRSAPAGWCAGDVIECAGDVGPEVLP